MSHEITKKRVGRGPVVVGYVWEVGGAKEKERYTHVRKDSRVHRMGLRGEEREGVFPVIVRLI